MSASGDSSRSACRSAPRPRRQGDAMFSTIHLQCFARHERGLPPGGARMCGGLITALWLAVTGFAQLAVAPSARAEDAAEPPGKLIKFVILSRHGVRAPI